MKDLMFSYDEENGERNHKVYDHIFDFTEEVESEPESAPPLNGKNVVAYFFENPITKQQFTTIEDLYYHCNLIMK